MSVHVVSLPWSRAWRGLTQVLRDRRILRQLDGVLFAVCGRSSGGDGTRDISRSLTLRREVVLVEWASVDAAEAGRAELARQWHQRGAQVWSATLATMQSKGSWRGNAVLSPKAGVTAPQLVASLTYARIRPTRMFHFYVHGFPSVARYATAPDSPMVAGIGFGDVPIRHACTVSFWPASADVATFAYAKGTPHGVVQQRSKDESWLSESLFARLAVIDHDGSWAGVDPLDAQHTRGEVSTGRSDDSQSRPRPTQSAGGSF